mmetsp:Transcript_32440/g.58672  ORF Transcript_32440/g.58672 Transcript_32440/m.58672 type:complete len:247 (-) Transcript_32440:371-1111(-)
MRPRCNATRCALTFHTRFAVSSLANLRHGTSRDPEGSESTAVPLSPSATSPNPFECALTQAHAIVSWRCLLNPIKKVNQKRNSSVNFPLIGSSCRVSCSTASYLSCANAIDSLPSRMSLGPPTIQRIDSFDNLLWGAATCSSDGCEEVYLPSHGASLQADLPFSSRNRDGLVPHRSVKHEFENSLPSSSGICCIIVDRRSSGSSATSSFVSRAHGLAKHVFDWMRGDIEGRGVTPMNFLPCSSLLA